MFSSTFSSAKFSLRLPRPPFDDSRADIILRSIDCVDFRVFKIILSLISPVFTEKFVTAQPASRDQKPGDDLPVVHLPEDSDTLDLALRHCYPTRSPNLANLRDAHLLLEFARKYQVDALCPSLTHYLTRAIETDPVGVYALAAQYQYEDIALEAARASLKLPISRLTSSDLSCIKADKYLQLVRYHSSCGAAACALTLQRGWFPSGNKWLWVSSDMSCCRTRDLVQDYPNVKSKSSSLRAAPRYLLSYLHRSAVVLAHQPSAEAITEEDFVLKDMDCNVCLVTKRADMLDFSRIFAAEIKKVIEQCQVPFTKPVNRNKLSTSAPSPVSQSPAATVKADSPGPSKNPSGNGST